MFIFAETESGYVDTSKLSDYGITRNKVYSSLVSETIFNSSRNTLCFSPNSVTGEEITYGRMVFANDKVNTPQALDDTSAAYMLEMEVSAIVRNNGIHYYTIMGKAFDGSTTTRWATENSENTKVESLTVDLGTAKELDCFKIDEFYSGGIRRTASCKVEVSDDNTVWNDCENTLTDNGIYGTTNRKCTLNLSAPATGRYFRISFTRTEACGESGVSVWEIEAYKNSDDSIEEITAADKSLKAKEWLGENAGTKAVTTNLKLPDEVNGMVITWSSSDTDVIAADGTVTRPSDSDIRITN